MSEKSSFLLINSVQFYSDYSKGDENFFLLSFLQSETGKAGMWLVSVSLAELVCGYRTERREMDTM